MAETVIAFEGQITGKFELDRSLAYAPKILAKYYARGLGRERNSFVGSKKKNKLGSFQNPLLRRRLWGGRVSRFSSMWSVNFLRHFRGKIYGGTPIQGMTLEMGISQTSKMRPAIEKLQTGGRVSGGWMIIPVYENLAKIGEFPKVGSSGRLLRSLTTSRKISVVKSHGMILWYDREKYKSDPHGALLFYGVRSINVSSQFNFDAAFERRKPAVMDRLAKDIDRGVAAINRGQFE